MLVSPEFVDEALCACEEHLNNLAHMDIDKDVEAPLHLSPEGWSLFLQRYYQVVSECLCSPGHGACSRAAFMLPAEGQGTEALCRCPPPPASPQSRRFIRPTILLQNPQEFSLASY